MPDPRVLLHHSGSAAPIEPADRDRLATALAFYINRLKWPAWDAERAEFERLLVLMENR